MNSSVVFHDGSNERVEIEDPVCITGALALVSILWTTCSFEVLRDYQRHLG